MGSYVRIGLFQDWLGIVEEFDFCQYSSLFPA